MNDRARGNPIPSHSLLRPHPHADAGAIFFCSTKRCVASSSSSSSMNASAGGSSGGGGGGWTAPQFRRWLAAYLRELRLSPVAAHRALVLRSARPLLEADPALGLSVFVDQQRQKRGGLLLHGGGRRIGAAGGGVGDRGKSGGRVVAEGRLSPHDVVSFLKTIKPSEVCRVIVQHTNCEMCTRLLSYGSRWLKHRT